MDYDYDDLDDFDDGWLYAEDEYDLAVSLWMIWQEQSPNTNAYRTNLRRTKSQSRDILAPISKSPWTLTNSSCLHFGMTWNTLMTHIGIMDCM